jgi:hypothetical protein
LSQHMQGHIPATLHKTLPLLARETVVAAITKASSCQGQQYAEVASTSVIQTFLGLQNPNGFRWCSVPLLPWHGIHRWLAQVFSRERRHWGRGLAPSWLLWPELLLIPAAAGLAQWGRHYKCALATSDARAAGSCLRYPRWPIIVMRGASFCSLWLLRHDKGGSERTLRSLGGSGFHRLLRHRSNPLLAYAQERSQRPHDPAAVPGVRQACVPCACWRPALCCCP